MQKISIRDKNMIKYIFFKDYSVFTADNFLCGELFGQGSR